MMPIELPQPPPPVEISIPREHRARFLQLQADADRCWAILEFHKIRSSRLISRGWGLGRALRAHKSALDAMRAYRLSTIALWEHIHTILPDTMVGQWNLDTVRMLATRQPVFNPLAQMLGGFNP